MPTSCDKPAGAAAAEGAPASVWVPLADGRRLCVAEYGAADGPPILYCHGFPGSRLEAALCAGAAQRLGLRLIAIDRPGFGGSDYQPGRRMGQWPGDLAAVADHLGLDRFAVLGLSGGGPYAVACAQHLPRRVACLGLVCPLGPLGDRAATVGMGGLEAGLIALMRAAPALALPLFRYAIGPVLGALPPAALAVLTGAAPAVDHRVLRERPVARILHRSIREAFRQGGRGPARDLQLYVHGWEIDPGAVQVPTRLWHGEADRTVPPAMGRAYAARLPRCRAVFLPGEGHFSLPVRHMDAILAPLASGL